MAVLPESMDRLDVQDPAGSLEVLENYIRYMGERIEFSVRNVTRGVTEAGVSSAELYLVVKDLGNTLAAVQGRINELAGTVTGLSTGQAELTGRTAALEAGITALEERVAALEADQTENGGA